MTGIETPVPGKPGDQQDAAEERRPPDQPASQSPTSAAPLVFTSERYHPEILGEIRQEHMHRYLWAVEMIDGLDIVDLASGEGFGSFMLAGRARSVVGIDVSRTAVDHATARYRGANLRFECADAARLPLADQSVDAVVSFETIEHLGDQQTAVAEIRRILKPNGFLVMSSPDKEVYSEKQSHVNPFHTKELTGPEFEALLGGYFPALRLFGQRLSVASSILARDPDADATASVYRDGEAAERSVREIPLSMYHVGVAAAEQRFLPPMPASFLVSAAYDVYWQMRDRAGESAAQLGHLATELAARTQQLSERVVEVETMRDRAAESETEKGRLATELAAQAQQLSERAVELEISNRRLARLDLQSSAVAAELAIAQGQVSKLTRQASDQATGMTGLLATVSSLESTVTALRQSTSWRVTAPLRALKRLAARIGQSAFGHPLALAGRAVKMRSFAPLRDWGAQRIIARSGLFDSDWYLRNYPDVGRSGLDPIRHYVLHGAQEGRDPSPSFNTRHYLAKNPGVGSAKINPLAHFISLRSSEPVQRTGDLSAETFRSDEKAPSADGSLLRRRPQSPIDMAGLHPDLSGVGATIDAGLSIVIPTLNAGAEFKFLLQKLLMQRGVRDIEIVIVDSGSQDGTVVLARDHGCTVVEIPPSSFSHSFARNVGARKARGNYLLFMVQDAYPIGTYWACGMLRYLLDHADQGLVAASCSEYSRSDSDIVYDYMIDTHYRFLGCRDEDRIGRYVAGDHISLRSNGQLSDVACLISRPVFERYEYRGDYAEDLDLGVRLIRDGHRVAMLASIKVIHSHNRSAYYYLRRSFVDVVFLVDMFEDFVPAPVRSTSGLMLGIVSTAAHLSDWNAAFDPHQPSARLQDDLAAWIGEWRQTFSRLRPDVRCRLGVAELDSWIDGLGDRFLKGAEVDRAMQTEAGLFVEAFFGRIDHFRSFTEGKYLVQDASLRREVGQAIVKIFAAAAGSALGFWYVDRSAPERDLKETIKGELRAGI